MSPIALRERELEHKVPMDIPNEQLGQNTTGVRSDTRRLENWVLAEHGDQGTVGEQPSALVSEYIVNDYQLSEDAQYTAQSGEYEGKCRCLGDVLSVNIHQFQREPRWTLRLGLPPLPPMSRRRL